MNIINVIDNMKRWDKRIGKLNNGWYIKQLNNFTLFELCNDEGNTFIECKSIREIENELEKVI